MQRWFGVVLGTITFGALCALGYGESNYRGLARDPDLPRIPPRQLNANLATPCVIESSRGASNNRKRRMDCVPGEVLAILNPNAFVEQEKTSYDALVGRLTAPNNPTFKSLLSSVNTPTNGPVAFTGVKAYKLPIAGANLSPEADACGRILLRFTFTIDPNKNEGVQVTDAIEQLKKSIKPGAGTITLPGQASLYAVQPNGTGKPAQSPQDEPTNTQTTPEWATTITGRTTLNVEGRDLVKVAVLDTGFSLGSSPNPAYVLKAKDVNNVRLNLVNLDDITNNVPNEQDVQDTYDGKLADEPVTAGHGTGVASIIADPDPTIGMAPNARIVPIKICGPDGMCQDASAIYATCLAASSDVNASVINMSFGSLPDSPIMQAAIQDVARANSLVVAAAGNTNDEKFKDKHPGTLPNPPVRPALYSSGPQQKLQTPPPPPNGVFGVMLSVGAIWTNLQYAPFATFNGQVDLVAPGSWVRLKGNDGVIHDSNSTPTDPDARRNYDGTSFAAAYVSGAAALLVGQPGTTFSARTLARQLLENANPSLCNPVSKCGAGLVQAK